MVKKNYGFHKDIKKQLFSTLIIIISVSLAENLHIRMIPE